MEIDPEEPKSRCYAPLKLSGHHKFLWLNILNVDIGLANHHGDGMDKYIVLTLDLAISVHAK